MSIHAVRAADTVLDVLERYDLPQQASCIFHWFSGTSNDLARLRRLGCHMSINERMLATRRGREYARQMPLERLHLETDTPPQLDEIYHASDLEASLTRCVSALARVRGVDAGELEERLATASSKLLGLPCAH